MGFLTSFLCKCSGVRMDALTQSPGSTNRAATQGAVFLLTSFIAATTAGYAISRIFYGEPHAMLVAVLGGFTWGLFVFALDRMLTMSIVKPAPWWRLCLQGLVRIPFAAVVAGTLSMPVILRVSASVIDGQLRRDQRGAVMAEQKENAGLEGLADKSLATGELSRKLDLQDARLRQEPDTFEWRSAQAALKVAEAERERVTTVNARRINAARSEITIILGRDRQSEDDAAAVKTLNDRIAGWQRATTLAADTHRQAAGVEAQLRRAWLEGEAKARADIHTGLQAAQTSESQAIERAADRTVASEVELRALMVPNLANQYAVYQRILRDKDHPDSAALWWWSIALHALFFLLEILPVAVKLMTPPDPLDTAAAALSELDKERSNLTANAKMAHLQTLTAAEVQAKQLAVDLWRQDLMNRMQQNPTSVRDVLNEIDDDVRRMAA